MASLAYPNPASNSEKDATQAAFNAAVLKFINEDVKDAEIHAKISQATSIDDIYREAKILQAEQAKHGRLRHLSKIEPFLTGLNDYSAAIGVFVQAKPDILAVIWGPVLLLLQWANALKASFDAIVDVIEEFGNALPEFKLAARLFHENERIGDVLLLFFKEIMEFYSIAFRFFRLSRWRYLFEAVWPKFRNKIMVVKQNVESHALLLRRDTQSEHIRQQHDLRVRALGHFDHTESVNRRQEYRGIENDMRPRWYDEKLHSVQSQVYEGTGKWLLESPVFHEWLNGLEKSKRCLWLQGIPGSGKTCLSTTVIQSAQSRGKTLFIFLTYTLADKTSALSVFHSLIFQLASQDEMRQSVVCNSSLEKLRTSLEVAETLLSNLVLACKEPVYIVVDGLDEISEGQRCLLVKRLMTLLDALEGLRVCLSSRPEADLKRCLANQPKSILRVDAENAEAIQVYVDQWTKNWLRDREADEDFKSEALRLLAPLALKSKGMFLYAFVMHKCVEPMDNIFEIENELRVLPESLDAAYERVFRRIGNLDPYSRTKACKILGWIACTPTPLTQQEMQHALVIRTEDREGNLPLQILPQFDRICGPIIEVFDDIVQFVHFTVKEYISSPRLVPWLDLGESRLSLAICCIVYLCQQHHDPELSEEAIRKNALEGKYVLHEFATSTWLDMVEKILAPGPRNVATPSELIRALQVLLEGRGNPDYIGDFEAKIIALKAGSPALHQLLAKAMHFRQEYSVSQHKRQKGSTWINLDPLTLSRTSVLVHETVDSLLDCQEAPTCQHESCDGCRLAKIYGAKRFTCRFICCPRRRLGFETRVARQTHEKQHDRPWKCSIPTCEYAKGGFLSRRMRDDHLDRYHQTNDTELITNATQPEPEPDEIEPLLFDLIQTDNLDAVISLLPVWKKLGHRFYSAKNELLRLAVSFGSPAMIDMLLDDYYLEPGLDSSVAAAAIDRGPDTFEQVLKRIDYGHSMTTEVGKPRCILIFQVVLQSGAERIFNTWEKFMDQIVAQHPVLKHRKLLGHFTHPSVMSTTAGFPDRAQCLLTVWKRYRVPHILGSQACGDALTRVAMTNLNIDMAMVLLHSGAMVDSRRSDVYLTALHQAARKTTIEAAEFAKFLLLCGADPNSSAGGLAGSRQRKEESKRERKKEYIRDTEGVKNISTHLGVTWDELIVQTKKQREEYLSQGYIDPTSVEALEYFARLAKSNEGSLMVGG
ncbi:hypothetical protein QBC39DRAFT_354018 [Podospora conica]|nr:hypothetical protein QBC39DRAFT_354018 [Schizothecium conicum]